MSSVHAAGILGFHDRSKKEDDDDPGFPANRDGWVRVLTDLGLSFDFVSSPQVEAGSLDPARVKVLILPLSFALSSKEARAIEAFAQAGGIVIADGAAGLMDEHCAWRTEGTLNELFGVGAPPSEKRHLAGGSAASAATLTADGIAWGLDAAALGGLALLETDVTPRGGSRPLATLGATPAVFARPVGKGWALYLDIPFDRYAQLRKEHFGGGGHRALLGGVLRHLGIGAAVTVQDGRGQGVGPMRVARYRLDDAEIVAVLAEPVAVEEIHGRDGVRVYDDSKLGPVVEQQVEIRLPRVGDVVNVRTGEYYGHTDRVRTSVVAGNALVLSVVPSRPTVALSGPSSGARGDHVTLALRIEGSAGKRLVRCQVFGPDGAFEPLYSRNVLAQGGTGEFVLPTALDDAPGRYRVKATDVVGGGTAEAQVEMR
jgi:Beta-galactosidase trimerisation domain